MATASIRNARIVEYMKNSKAQLLLLAKYLYPLHHPDEDVSALNTANKEDLATTLAFCTDCPTGKFSAFITADKEKRASDDTEAEAEGDAGEVDEGDGDEGDGQEEQEEIPVELKTEKKKRAAPVPQASAQHIKKKAKHEKPPRISRCTVLFLCV